MKKLITTAVVVALALTSSVVSAQSVSPAATNRVSNEKMTLKVEEIKPLQFRLTVENPAHQKMNIVLEDKNKNILFEDFAGTDAKYGKVLDLSNVIDGTYTFFVNGKKGKVSQSFDISTKTTRVALAKADK